MIQDPYKYFRVEARELLDGLTESALALEKGIADHDRISGLLRLAHTLKGAARVVKQPGIADLAHEIEGIVSPLRDDEAASPKDRARQTLQVLDQISAQLAALLQPISQTTPNGKTAALPEILETVRVDVEELEALLGRLSEIGSQLNNLEDTSQMVQRAKRQSDLLMDQLQPHVDSQPALTAGRVRSFAEKLQDSLHLADHWLGESAERMAREFGQAEELANRLRLVPASAVFPVLERAVRDAAVTLRKQARIDMAGGEIRLEANVLILMRDALVQLLRNAVAHGIEDASLRASAGKPPVGRIDFRVERRGNRVAFLCRDDGAGIDLSAIRQVAVQKGLVSPSESERLGLPQAVDMLFRGGLSTTGQVNEISGRGIGLDVVRAAVGRLKGEISVETSRGGGTGVEIKVPASLVSVLALTVDAGGSAVSLPLDCVRQTVRLDADNIARCGEQESIAYQGQAIPFLRLSSVMDADGRASFVRRWSTVIIASGPVMAAIGVDRLRGTGTVLVRSLPALAPAASFVNGATLDRYGNPRLFLDPAGLVELAARGSPQTQAGNSTTAPVLVIDDSLTTRMVEQSILESAGYQVDLAISGEEALEKSLARHYGLFLVDVEMPGMDGFEFISRTRQDPVLRNTPAILVTSRMSPEDRQRGEDAGALAYIVKSEFEQGSFLQTIERLIRP